MLVIGSTGGGKSVLLQTTTLQTALRFGFIVVIDDGLSWMTTCHKLDPTSRPIIVRSNGNQTFNIFDTRGLPLSAEHLSKRDCALSFVGRPVETMKTRTNFGQRCYRIRSMRSTG